MEYWNPARLFLPVTVQPGWRVQPHMTQRLHTNLRACLPCILVAMAANFADSILTSVGLRLGCTEANPVADPLLSSTVCIFAKQLFIPVVAILGALLLSPVLCRIAAKSFCLLFTAVAALNICTLTTGYSFLPETSNTGGYTPVSWFLGVYASMAVAFVVAFVQDHLIQLRKRRGRL